MLQTGKYLAVRCVYHISLDRESFAQQSLMMEIYFDERKNSCEMVDIVISIDCSTRFFLDKLASLIFMPIILHGFLLLTTWSDNNGNMVWYVPLVTTFFRHTIHLHRKCLRLCLTLQYSSKTQNQPDTFNKSQLWQVD